MDIFSSQWKKTAEFFPLIVKKPYSQKEQKEPKKISPFCSITMSVLSVLKSIYSQVIYSVL